MSEKDVKDIEKKPNIITRFFKSETSLLFTAFVVFVIFVSIVNPRFISIVNIRNVLAQVSVMGICAMSVLMIMISGGIDLSLSWAITLIGSFCAYLLTHVGLGAIPAVLLSMLLGMCMMGAQGLLISRLPVEPFIISLGFSSMFCSFSYLITNGSEIPLNLKLKALNQFPLGLSTLVYVFALVALIVSLVLRFTKFGRRIYAVGCNRDAAFLAGIDVKNMRLAVYMIHGLITGLASCLLIARIDTASLTMSTSTQLDVITACVVGGTSMRGGKGKVIGVLVGVLFLGCLSNSMTLMSINTYYSDLIKGIIIIFSIVFANIDAIKKPVKKTK